MSDDLAVACPQCGVVAPIEHRFCEACGARLAPVADGDTQEGDRREIDAGTAAGLTNPGLVKSSNQDALYLDRSDGRVVAVVCDGVSSSVAAEAAARVACTAAGRALSGNGVELEPEAAMRAAVAVAQRAVLGIPWETSSPLGAPACTFVGAVWDGTQITVGSLGDSRAYWIDGDDAQCLSIDDSWLREQVDIGLMTPEEAAEDPRAHQITRWLGADAPDAVPNITAFVPDRRGWLTVCSDGLWNYAPRVEDLATWINEADTAKAPIELARNLVDRALARGGHDNITVAVIDVVPHGKEAEQ
jgi:serine/threonine protein phosphatase PrpC